MKILHELLFHEHAHALMMENFPKSSTCICNGYASVPFPHAYWEKSLHRGLAVFLNPHKIYWLDCTPRFSMELIPHATHRFSGDKSCIKI